MIEADRVALSQALDGDPRVLLKRGKRDYMGVVKIMVRKPQKELTHIRVSGLHVLLLGSSRSGILFLGQKNFTDTTSICNVGFCIIY